MIVTVAKIDDLNAARVVVAALKAHGLHPIEPGDGGLPGVANPLVGSQVLVPEEEETDARMLIEALLAELGK